MIHPLDDGWHAVLQYQYLLLVTLLLLLLRMCNLLEDMSIDLSSLHWYPSPHLYFLSYPHSHFHQLPQHQ